MRTCSSVLNSISIPSNVYKKEITKNDCLPEHQPVLKPKNNKQISDVQAGLSRFAISIPGFPKLPFLVWQYWGTRSYQVVPTGCIPSSKLDLVPTSYWRTRSHYREPGQSSLVPTGCTKLDLVPHLILEN